MTSPCVSCLARASCQPIGREYITSDGKTFVKEMDIAEAGTIIPQHSHPYEHISYVARGAVLFDGRLIRSGTPEAAILVPAFKKHTFQAMEPDTLVLCIHSGTPVIHEEHELVEV
jgi:quercetin dioxygenase-like cupin family protein